METSKKIGLVVFDFDNTIIDGNTDVEIRSLIEGEVPNDIKKLFSGDNWTDYMQAIFRHIHEQGIRKEDYEKSLLSIPFCQRLPDLIRWLSEKDYEIIIISDSNLFFIECILKANGLSPLVTEIFTNPARFNSDDLLVIEWFHSQDYCDLSTVNMCKGQILEDYWQKRRSEGVTFERTLYVGDGSNDYCPALRLKNEDLVFARKGFRLEAQINSGEKGKVKADFVTWSSGDDIKSFLENYVHKP